MGSIGLRQGLEQHVEGLPKEGARVPTFGIQTLRGGATTVPQGFWQVLDVVYGRI